MKGSKELLYSVCWHSAFLPSQPMGYLRQPSHRGAPGSAIPVETHCQDGLGGFQDHRYCGGLLQSSVCVHRASFPLLKTLSVAQVKISLLNIGSPIRGCFLSSIPSSNLLFLCDFGWILEKLPLLDICKYIQYLILKAHYLMCLRYTTHSPKQSSFLGGWNPCPKQPWSCSSALSWPLF